MPGILLHFELCTWGAPCIIKVYELVSLLKQAKRGLHSAPYFSGGLNQAHFCTVQVQEKDELSRHLLYGTDRLQLPKKSLKHQF